MSTIFVVDDDENIQKLFKRVLVEEGHEVVLCDSGSEVVEKIQDYSPDLVLLDVNLPDIKGPELVPQILAAEPFAFVIVISGDMTVDVAMKSTELGAFDYLSKPFTKSSLLHVVQQALESRRFHVNRAAYEKISKNLLMLQSNRLIGSSRLICSINLLIDKLAKADEDLIITGEYGTEKEKIARIIHETSNRFSGPFITLNPSAVPRPIICTELFGTESSKTGSRTETGLYELAKGGTLFISEFTDLDYKSIRVLAEYLETGHISVNHKLKNINTRIILSTSLKFSDFASLGEDFKKIAFALEKSRIHLPPLRERKLDLRDIITLTLQRINLERGKSIKQVSESAFEILTDYRWPGNMLELWNALERIVILAREDEHIVTPKNVNKVLNTKSSSTEEDSDRHSQSFSEVFLNTSETGTQTFAPLHLVEKEYIRQVLNYVHYDTRKASELLGITPATLKRKMALLEIPDHSLNLT